MDDVADAAQRLLDATEVSFSTWADLGLLGVEERVGALEEPLRAEVRQEIERRLRGALLNEVHAMAEAVGAMRQ